MATLHYESHSERAREIARELSIATAAGFLSRGGRRGGWCRPETDEAKARAYSRTRFPKRAAESLAWDEYDAQADVESAAVGWDTPSWAPGWP